MLTISFHVKVRVAVTEGVFKTSEEFTTRLADEIKSNLESLGGEGDIEDILADVTMIGREQS